MISVMEENACSRKSKTKMYYSQYSDTAQELKIASSRLKYLKEKKETLYVALVGVKSPNGKTEASGSGGNKDKMLEYYHATEEKPQANGLTINAEISQLEKEIEKLKKLKKEMENCIGKMNTIESVIYYQVACRGKKPNDAVKFVAQQFGYAESTIWNSFYPNVKAELRKIRRIRKGS